MTALLLGHASVSATAYDCSSMVWSHTVYGGSSEIHPRFSDGRLSGRETVRTAVLCGAFWGVRARRAKFVMEVRNKFRTRTRQDPRRERSPDETLAVATHDIVNFPSSSVTFTAHRSYDSRVPLLVVRSANTSSSPLLVSATLNTSLLPPPTSMPFSARSYALSLRSVKIASSASLSTSFPP